MSIAELITAGNMSAELAAMFWVAMEKGASLILAADPPHSGKTTTLSALLAFTLPNTLVYFTRGVGETFTLPPPTDDYHTYILVNEMSDHIPVYTWDDHARRAFELLHEGYQLGTTMHADTVEGVIQQLEGDLRIPKRHVAGLTFIVPMYIGRGDGYGYVRRITEVAMLEPTGEGYRISQAATWDRDEDTHRLFPKQGVRDALAQWAGITPVDLDVAIATRQTFLENLINAGTTTIPEVNAALLAFQVEEFGISEDD
jgi:type IV secretory pathway ATPase VirB11/archaellum biosynthesis ATPase